MADAPKSLMPNPFNAATSAESINTDAGTITREDAVFLPRTFQ